MTSKPIRTPLSMQTEQAKQQQLITFAMLTLLLGPITTAVAGLLTMLAGKHMRRMAWCALFGAIGLAVGAWFWPVFVEQVFALKAFGGRTMAALQSRSLRTPADFRTIGEELWPLLWWWWRQDLLLAPLTALNMLANRVKSAEEQERERITKQQQAAAAQARLARAAVAKAPISTHSALVLGIPLGVGDLPWQQGAYLTYPAESLARHGAVIGSSGVGKSETVLRLADGARRAYGWKVFFVDCKGEQALAERFAATMQAAGAARVGMFPAQPLDGWRGEPIALLNRLLAVLDYSEPYYRDMTKMLLNLALEAPPAPPHSSTELLERMVLSRLRQLYAGRPEASEIDGIRPQDAAGAYNRYRAFFKALQGGLDGTWSFDDVDAGYILLDGLTLKDQTASLGRCIVEDFAHYVAQRKPKDVRVLLIIDEFPVMAFSSSGTASLFEMVRFHGASIFVTGQSYAGMGQGFDRILGAAETLILHRTGDPDKLLPRAGQRLSFRRRIGFSERGMGGGAREYATGDGSLAMEEESKIHPNAVKELPRGECFVIAGGKCQRVLVKMVAPPPVNRTAETPPLPAEVSAQLAPRSQSTPLSLPVERPAPARRPRQAATEAPSAEPATYDDEEDT
jgi:hypothetical protein